jgi:hypothetical protein
MHFGIFTDIKWISLIPLRASPFPRRNVFITQRPNTAFSLLFRCHRVYEPLDFPFIEGAKSVCFDVQIRLRFLGKIKV